MAFDLGRLFTVPARPSWLQKTGIGVATGAAAAALVAVTGGSTAPLLATALAGGTVGGIQGSRSNKDAGTVALQSAVGGGLTGGVVAIGSSLAKAGEAARLQVVGNKAISVPGNVGGDILAGLGVAARKTKDFLLAAPGKVENAVLEGPTGTEARKTIGKAFGDALAALALGFGARKANEQGQGGGGAGAGAVDAGRPIPVNLAGPGVVAPAAAQDNTMIYLIVAGVVLVVGFFLWRKKR